MRRHIHLLVTLIATVTLAACGTQTTEQSAGGFAPGDSIGGGGIDTTGAVGVDAGTGGQVDPDAGGTDPSDPDAGGTNPGDPDAGSNNPGDPDGGGTNPGDKDTDGTDPGDLDPDKDAGGTNPGDPDAGGGNPNDPDTGGGNPGDKDAGAPQPTCVDADGDGYGQGCAAGPDCDDGNLNFAVVCPDCTTANHPGCKCQGVAANCYSGEQIWIGKGVCQAGVQLCKGGYWGECNGEVLPTPEVCDAKDNNCNGLIDDGVLSTCGTCDMSCTQQSHGPDYGNAFDPSKDSSNGVGVNKNGYIELDAKKANVDLNHIWIAGTGAKVISKLNTKTGAEVGRYNSCSSPSRTSVDINGDVWVGCRSGGQVMKIINKKAACPDKNGNGVIETAEDLNGNNVIDSNEMKPYGSDECVRFIVKPDPGEGTIRAAGVDKDNHVWVGGWNKKTLWRLHPDTGAVVDSINIGCNPYGLVIDQKGIIWISGRGCSALLEVDPKTKQIQNRGHGGKGSPYGINVDMFGRIWIANTNTFTSRYDPLTKVWNPVGHNNRSRGVATSNDGHVYVALDSTSTIAKINAVTATTVAHASLGAGRYPVGIAVDYDGFIWAVNQSKSSASKIDPKTLQVIGEYPVGQSPYTYSDMTGYTLNNYTAPKGHYTHVFGFSGWSGTVNETKTTTVWETLDIESVVPPQAFVKVRYIAGETLKELETGVWSKQLGPFPPQQFPIDLKAAKVEGRFLKVEVFLQAGKDKLSPIVKSIKAKGKQIAMP